MKSVLPLTAILALFSASSAVAANLTIPMAFEYLALDGQQVASSKFNHKADLDLSNGTHKIAIRYHDMIEDDFSDSPDFVKSSPFIVTIAVDGDHNYQLLPAEGKVIKNPKAFAKAPQVVITRKDGGEVNYKIVQTNLTESSFVSKIFSGESGTDIDAAAAAATSTGAELSQTGQSIAAGEAVPTTLPAQIPAQLPANGDANHAQQMLQYWWLHADEQTRKEFMSWAIKQL
ncbi:DUF2057 domain-containing protein [Shewanella sp. AS1]|uniref:DUF2057 domain-containing protein n=1 Tax=Shewanella sp. AS1 TaxID=2907626 RepID=UPI001F337548|nr:DUF2057 domain-containing protein [Shewanella sp. AS1]MCE9678264.1 DUF2057 domain-containing protein [Shewanella sp. AS1]